jgi:lipoyl(octanoyl) transferase
MRKLEVVDLGRVRWDEAWAIQREYVERRKSGLGPDTLLFAEHPHVITMGRNAEEKHILAGREWLEGQGIGVYETDRGGDVTYHGPGQIVGYPIFDVSEWRKDLRAYVKGLEEAVVRTLGEYGIAAHTREGKETGVYVRRGDGAPAKICALGIHMSRWVSSHGFALNWKPELRYFQLIVPCGLTLPVTSMAELGVEAEREEVMQRLTRHLAEIFGQELPTRIEQLQETH